MQAVRLTCIELLCLVFASLPAWSHGGAPLDLDSCTQRIGLYLVHFVAYQPQFRPAEEYCETIPKTGKTIFVFDLVDQELRRMPLAVRIVQAADASAPRTLLEIPPKTYPNGVVNAEADLTPPGEYMAIITAQEPQQTIEFPVRVGMWSTTLLLSVSLLLGGVAFYYFVGRTRGWPLLPARADSPPRLRVVKNPASTS